jgi:hypothetical protein
LTQVLDQTDAEAPFVTGVATASPCHLLGHPEKPRKSQQLGMVTSRDGRHDRYMTSLHIEHSVSDVESWLATFRSFDDFRAQGGVTSVQVRHGVDNPNFIAVDLEFGSAEQARSFLVQLETQVWPNSSHFDGTPTTYILETL